MTQRTDCTPQAKAVKAALKKKVPLVLTLKYMDASAPAAPPAAPPPAAPAAATGSEEPPAGMTKRELAHAPQPALIQLLQPRRVVVCVPQHILTVALQAVHSC